MGRRFRLRTRDPGPGSPILPTSGISLDLGLGPLSSFRPPFVDEAASLLPVSWVQTMSWK